MTAPAAVLLTEEDAAWIREHAWTRPMRTTYAETPGLYDSCPCQWGTSSHCQHGHHERCHVAEPLTFPHRWITDTADRVWGRDDSAVQVWHADRVCRWLCPCDCHTAPAQPRPVQQLRPVQPSLF